jgi:dynein heavy chain, axonemal
VLADDISEKQAASDITEAKIDEARAGYKPVAHHSSLLYFAVGALQAILVVCQACC